jgi:hypothetical protein
MQLESLKSSKFEAFKGSELQNSFKVLGGQVIATESESNTRFVTEGAKGGTTRGTARDRRDEKTGCEEILFQDGYWH